MDGLLAVGLFGLLDMFLFDPVQHIIGLNQPCQIDPGTKKARNPIKNTTVAMTTSPLSQAPMAAELRAFVRVVFFPNHGFTFAVRRKWKKIGGPLIALVT